MGNAIRYIKYEISLIGMEMGDDEVSLFFEIIKKTNLIFLTRTGESTFNSQD